MACCCCFFGKNDIEYMNLFIKLGDVEIKASWVWAELDNILIKDNVVFSMKENAEKISITSFLR